MTQVVIVGEAWGEREELAGKPFVGPAGHLLDAFLNAAGIVRRDLYLTNVFNLRPPGNRIPALCGPKAEGIPDMPAIDTGKYVRVEYADELNRLYREIKALNPNVVVALGGTACWALLKDRRIKRLRGSPTIGVTGHKVLPTYHPAAVLREMKLRPIVFSDFGKIVRESAYPEIRRPKREFWLEPTLADLAAFEPFIRRAKKLSVDIETWNRQITCIGFAPDESRAIVIPFIWHGRPAGNYWPTLSDELFAWHYVKKWLNFGIPLVGQNFHYDLNYLWTKYGIAPHGAEVHDTMLLHHAMQPEMEKSLAFLSSIYTTEPQHKFMRTDIKTLKKED